MKINSIQNLSLKNNYYDLKSKEKHQTVNPQKQLATNNIHAYKDFNISFTGRTPEDFYVFNKDSMPYTMKNYLEYDYEERRHIPPEQIMQEVFKYIDSAETLEDVKKMYPNEDLFKKIHDDKKHHGLETFLGEVNMTKEMIDTPLFKDGSDDLGLYLLKKIYIEGKTVKEISNDFYNKDVNDEYKEFVTKPIQYDTTSAYGIRYPKIGFWHSFINTRDEYKKFFVTLPKNSYDPNRDIQGATNPRNSGSNSSSKVSTETPVEKPVKPRRKYQIKSYKKDQIKRDINDSDMSQNDIEKRIKRRFSHEDPEASFIVKYLSPIMIVAADNVKLSEEMKAFNDYEKRAGKTSDDAYMLKRFWKANPYLKSEYSSAITNAIEIFEDVYGAGGFIKVDKDFNEIQPNDKTTKVVDYVSEDFFDFVKQVNKLETERADRYKIHDEMQSEYEEFFKQLDSEAEKLEKSTPVENKVNIEDLDPNVVIDDVAKEYNADTYKLNGKNGEDIVLAGKLDEVVDEFLKSSTKYFPSKYAKAYTNFYKSNPDLTERLKLSIATLNARDLIDDDRIMSEDEFALASHNIEYATRVLAFQQEQPVIDAMSDLIVKNNIEEGLTRLYQLSPMELSKVVESEEVLQGIFTTQKRELNELANNYSKPLTPTEKNKIILKMSDILSSYEPDENLSIANDDTKAITLMMKDICKPLKYKRDSYKDLISCVLEQRTSMRSILSKDINQVYKVAKFESCMESVIRELIRYTEKGDPLLLDLLNREVYDKHKDSLSLETRSLFERVIAEMTPKHRKSFEAPINELKNLDIYYPHKK